MKLKTSYKIMMTSIITFCFFNAESAEINNDIITSKSKLNIQNVCPIAPLSEKALNFSCDDFDPPPPPKSSSSTWDVLHKWRLPSKNEQTQDIVWNSRLNRTVAFRQIDDTSIVSLWSLNHDTDSSLNKSSSLKQGWDYADGYYLHFSNKIRAFKDCSSGSCSSGRMSPEKTFNLIQPTRASGNIKIQTDGKTFSGWGTWAGATDGRYAVTASFAKVENNSISNTKNYLHVFVYKFNTSNLSSNSSHLHPIRAFRVPPKYSRNQYVQGAEVANNKVYVQLGGLHNYDNDYKNVILEFTIDGKYIQTHELEAKNVINTGSTESNYPSYLHVEYEGLMEKNGKIYAQVFYQYGWSSKTTKSLVYQAIDSSRKLSTRVKFINKAKPYGNSKEVCIDGEGSTTKAWKKQNVQSYICDGGPDQVFELWRNGKALSSRELGRSGKIPEYDNSGNELWFEIRPTYVKPGGTRPSLCLDASGFSGGRKANVQFWDCENLADQQWRMMHDGRLINRKQRMCLDISGYDGKSNKNIQLFPCDYYLDQHWNTEITYF